MTTVKVNTFHKGEIEVDVEVNEKLSWLKGKVIYDKCPVCGALAENDLLYHGDGKSGMGYACGHEAHFENGKEPIYK